MICHCSRLHFSPPARYPCWRRPALGFVIPWTPPAAHAARACAQEGGGSCPQRNSASLATPWPLWRSGLAPPHKHRTRGCAHYSGAQRPCGLLRRGDDLGVHALRVKEDVAFLQLIVARSRCHPAVFACSRGVGQPVDHTGRRAYSHNMMTRARRCGPSLRSGTPACRGKRRPFAVRVALLWGRNQVLRDGTGALKMTVWTSADKH